VIVISVVRFGSRAALNAEYALVNGVSRRSAAAFLSS
jgi:hypothetical protein